MSNPAKREELRDEIARAIVTAWSNAPEDSEMAHLGRHAIADVVLPIVARVERAALERAARHVFITKRGTEGGAKAVSEQPGPLRDLVREWPHERVPCLNQDCDEPLHDDCGHPVSGCPKCAVERWADAWDAWATDEAEEWEAAVVERVLGTIPDGDRKAPARATPGLR